MKTLQLLAALALSLAQVALAGDPPSTHGMLMVGTERVFLSHLPMFHNPHDYQGIFELEMTPAARATYSKDRKAHPGIGIYTLVPESFVLPEMAKNPKPFHAAIFRGHFERAGNIELIADTVVNFKAVPYFARFLKSGKHPVTSQFLLFGGGTEFFLAHLITAKPDFDQVVEVSGVTPALAKQAEAGPAVTVELKDLASESTLKEGDSVSGIHIEREFYLEFGDLQ